MNPFQEWLTKKHSRRYGPQEAFMRDAWKAGRLYEKKHGKWKILWELKCHIDSWGATK